MAAPAWTAPAWTRQVPSGVTFTDEIKLLKGLVKQSAEAGFHVVRPKDLDFDTKGYADLVLERQDGARLLFALAQKAAGATARVDVNARPRSAHVELRLIEGEWRIVTGSRILDPRRVADLGLAGLAEILLDSRL